MRELVEFLVQSLVPDSTRIHVTEEKHGDQIVFDVQVPESEAGKLIGRNGRIIQSIRAVVKAAAVRRGVHVNVEVNGRSRRPGKGVAPARAAVAEGAPSQRQGTDRQMGL